MPGWWDKLTGRTRATDSPDPASSPAPQAATGRKETSAAPAPAQERAKWLAADDPRNPFRVPLLDLMMLQGFISLSKDPASAARSTSWGASVGKELAAEPLLALAPIECSLRYPAVESLPDGILYAPPSMDFKWVFALREGRVLAARSWSGTVEAVADARRDGDCLVLERLRVAEPSGLRLSANVVDVFDWLFRVHVWGQRLPLPVDERLATMLEEVPLSGFGPFGKALFCASKTWSPPPAPRPLRSDGDVILAARNGDVAALKRAVAEGADIDAPGTHSRTALHLAVMKGDVALFDEIVKLGGNPATVAEGGLHALGIAVVHKAPLPLLERLATAGFELSLPNADGFTALHGAAEVDNAAIVPWLLARGLPLEARTKHGHTALHVACALGHADAARALLLAGADARATSPSGTPRDVALAENKPALVELLNHIT
jgi:hypothetical protein